MKTTKIICILTLALFMGGCVEKTLVPSNVIAKINRPFDTPKPINEKYFIKYPVIDTKRTMTSTKIVYIDGKEYEKKIEILNDTIKQRMITDSEALVEITSKENKEKVKRRCEYIVNIGKGTVHSFKCSDSFLQEHAPAKIKHDVKIIYNAVLNGIKTGSIIEEVNIPYINPIMSSFNMQYVAEGLSMYNGKEVLVAKPIIVSKKDVLNIKTKGYALYYPKTLELITSHQDIYVSAKYLGVDVLLHLTIIRDIL